MSLQETKWNVMQKIMNVSQPSLLDKINKLLEKEMIVGYTVNGNPLTKEAYDGRLQKAEEQLSKENFISQEDLEQELDKW